MVPQAPRASPHAALAGFGVQFHADNRTDAYNREEAPQLNWEVGHMPWRELVLR